MTSKIYRHPSDPAAPTDETNAAQAAEGQGNEQGAPPEDPITRLQAEVAAARAESEQWRDRFLRKAAEFENYRKRMDRERADSSFLARSSIISEFLPIVDACERALGSLDSREPDEKIERFREGVQLLYKQIGDTLKRLGVEPMKTEGKPFDPNFHEALSRQPTSQYSDNTVVHELRRGYLYQGRLLRAAQVVVSTRPLEDEPARV